MLLLRMDLRGSPARRSLSGLLMLAVALGLLGGGQAVGATVSYPLAAYYLPSSQSSNLQAALDQYHEVRLDHGLYNTGANTPIVMRSGYRLYGLTSKIPPVTIAPGATNVVLSDVFCATLTFPASNLVTSNNLIVRLLDTDIVSTGATLEGNLFLDLYACTLTVDNSASGHFLNNRIIRLVGQGRTEGVSVIGDGNRVSAGNTFLWLNELTPTPATQGCLYFSNLADLALVGMDYESYTSSTQPAIQTGSMGTYRHFGMGGSMASGFPFDISADEFQVTLLSVSNPGSVDCIYRAPNQRALVQSAYRDNITDQSTASTPFRLNAQIGSSNTAVFAGATLSGSLSSANQAMLGTMLNPTRSAVPWERPTFPAPPDPAGPSWNVGLSGQADSLAMIQQLINVAAANGTYAILPAGIYYISGPLTLGTTNGLVGAGMDQTVIVAMNPANDMIVGDGTPGLTLRDLTLEGGANGIHHSPATCGSAPTFTNMHISHVTFRNMSQAGIFIDLVYGWDNNFLDNLNFIACPSGILQNPSPLPVSSSNSEVGYIDKTVFYACQFIGCGTALNMPANRSNNSDCLINCLIRDSTVAAANLIHNNEFLCANCTFINNAGNPAFGSSGLEFVSCDFQAGANGQAMALSDPLYFEGCTFELAGGSGATILGSASGIRQFFTGCQSADMPVGGANAYGVVLNCIFSATPSFSSAALNLNAGSQLVLSSLAPTPAPQLLVGSAFPPQFINTIAGVVPPQVAIGLPAASGGKAAVRSGDTVTFTVTYTGAAAVTLANGDVTVVATGTAAATATVSGSGSGTAIRTVTLSGISGDGSLTISLAAGTAIDSNGNLALAASPGITIPVIDTPPSATLSSSTAALTAANPIPVSVTFSNPVSGLVPGDLVVSNGVVTAFSGSGASYAVSIVPAAQGLVTVNLGAGVALDAAGNASLAASPLTRTYSTAGPTVTINQAANQADPTSTPSAAFTVVFNMPVTGFSANSVLLGGTATGTLTAAVAPVGGAGTTYTVTVTGMTGSGTVTASIPPNQVIANSAPNSASVSVDNQVTYIAPVTSAAAASNSSSSKCGGGFHAAILPLMLLGLWRRRRC